MAIEDNRLPKAVMLTTHPQRWTDKWGAWMYELLAQNIKNVIKDLLSSIRER